LPDEYWLNEKGIEQILRDLEALVNSELADEHSIVFENVQKCLIRNDIDTLLLIIDEQLNANRPVLICTNI
jgi:hypothetical protein